MFTGARCLGKLVALLAFACSASAAAHPMGTLSINRSAVVEVSPDRILVHYVVDFAEVPSVAEAKQLEERGRHDYSLRMMGMFLPRLRLSLDGNVRALAVNSCDALASPGQGGLPVVLLTCLLEAEAVGAGRLRFEDQNFTRTPGWREILIVGRGIDVGAGAPPECAVAGEVPIPFQSSKATMTLSVAAATVGVAGASGAPVARFGAPKDRFAALIATGDLSPWFVVFALVAALFLGAAHALSPGHGKTLVAAYLVGEHGTVRHAVLLGLTVTATHVSSVLLLGAITLTASRYLVAEALFPWIGVVSGAGVVAVGVGLLWSRVRNLRSHGGKHDHGHSHDHGPVRRPRYAPLAASRTRLDLTRARFKAAAPEATSLRRLLLLGIAGGAVPCPSALVVLLSAIALHRIAFGMLLIVAFSLGLAVVLVAIGILVVRAQRLLNRFSAVGRAAAWLPLVGACTVTGLGLAIAVQSALEGGLL